MSNQTGRSIRAQLMWLSLIIVTVSVALSLAGTLYITLRTERKTLDQNLLNSASILSQVPLVREALLGEVPADELADFLDAATARTSDIDLILVGDTESVLRYAPDRSFIGSRYTGSAQTRAWQGRSPIPLTTAVQRAPTTRPTPASRCCWRALSPRSSSRRAPGCSIARRRWRCGSCS